MGNVKNKAASKALSAVSIVLIVVLSLVLIHNLFFIVMGAVKSDEPPSLFGITPLVVLSGSMDGENSNSFPAGSMLLLKPAKDFELGDVVTYREPSSSKLTLVTHRIIEIIPMEDGTVQYRLQGDANNTPDRFTIGAENIIGEYWFHLPHVGNFALFLQQPLGMLLFIGVPVIAFILYDILRNQRQSKKKDAKTAEMEAELERLRALAGEKTAEAEAEPAPEGGEPAEPQTGEAGQEDAPKDPQ